VRSIEREKEGKKLSDLLKEQKPKSPGWRRGFLENLEQAV
jgi:hypothetical protein